MNNPPLRIAIFASVSSLQQATIDKDSLPSQLRDGRLWANSAGGDVVATFEVPGHSRKYIFFQDAEREIPAYARLKEACEQGAFDVLWCRARDRLGRTDALIAQVEALAAGAEVYSTTMPTTIGETSEASALFLVAIKRAQAQVENVVKTKRHRTGMRARVLGGLPANNWPHSYRAVRDGSGQVVAGEFVPGEIEAARTITELYLKGHGVPYIVKVLNDSPWRPRRADR
jgi:DNA invertase Pin-like site-specific DNA recombinase